MGEYPIKDSGDQPPVYYSQTKADRQPPQLERTIIKTTGETTRQASIRIRVRLTPRAARDEIAGWQDDVLRVRVTAPPIEGKANAALERLLARSLRLPKRAVRVVSGAKSRDKTVAIDPGAQADVMAQLRS